MTMRFFIITCISLTGFVFTNDCMAQAEKVSLPVPVYNDKPTSLIPQPLTPPVQPGTEKTKQEATPQNNSRPADALEFPAKKEEKIQVQRVVVKEG